MRTLGLELIWVNGCRYKLTKELFLGQRHQDPQHLMCIDWTLILAGLPMLITLTWPGS